MEETLLVSGKEDTESRTLTGKSRRKAVTEELKKVSYLALPMLVVTILETLLRVVSLSMVGHLGELQLAGTAIATSLTNVTGFSLLFGMASALETLCGQAYGAGQFKKIGSYTYSGILSLHLVCIPISLLWFYMDKLLILIGQDPLISAEARRFSLWLIPSLFPYAILQSLICYLQAQSLILPMLWTSVVALLFHIPVCWAMVFKLELGNSGAALAICMSYTLNVILLGLYVRYSSACAKTRVNFSKDDVFPSIWQFFRFAIPSTIMLCLEWWTFEIVILLSGLMPNPQLETSVLSICFTITSSHYLVPESLAVAASTRVSNELGAGNPKAARMAIWVVIVVGLVEEIIASTILLFCGSFLGHAFANDNEVLFYLKKMVPFLCISVIVDCLGGVLSGVARGSGWQHIGVYVNLGAYYLAGIPVALVLGFVLRMGGRGLWVGLIVGSLVQVLLLALVTCFTDLEKQATEARTRIFEEQRNDDDDDDEKPLLIS